MNYNATPVYGKDEHCLSFWYYMAGYVGKLTVYITDGSGRQSLAWFRSDDHGLMWRQGEIDLPAESFPLLEVSGILVESSKGYLSFQKSCFGVVFG